MADDKDETVQDEQGAAQPSASEAPADAAPAEDASAAEAAATPAEGDAPQAEPAPPAASHESDDEDEDEDDDDQAAAPVSKPGHKAAASDHGHGAANGHAAHAPGDAHDHGLAHVASLQMLFGVWGGLMVLTVLTVSVTHYDLGASGNLMVAMGIATIKAVMVMAFFMHLLYDKRFNVLVFLSSVLFVVLFLTLTIQDRNEYQPDIDAYQAHEAELQ